MRISDWSSDVCSSDLIQPLDAVLIVRVDNSAGPRIFHHRHIFPDGVIGFHLEPPPIRPHRRAYAVVAQQIGDLVGFDRVMECRHAIAELLRSEEHTSELQSLMRISYAVFCLK